MYIFFCKLEFHLRKIRERLNSSSFRISPNSIDRTSRFKWHLPRLRRSIGVCLVEPFVHWMSPSWPHIWRDIAYYTVSMLRIMWCNTRLSKSQRYNRRLPRWSTYGVILLTIRRIIRTHDKMAIEMEIEKFKAF